MTTYRGVEIKCEKFGSFAGGTSTNSIERCRATVNNQTLKGTLEEVKKKIDAELGPERSEK